MSDTPAQLQPQSRFSDLAESLGVSKLSLGLSVTSLAALVGIVVLRRVSDRVSDGLLNITSRRSFPVYEAVTKHPSMGRLRVTRALSRPLELSKLVPPASLAPNKELEAPIRKALLDSPTGACVLYAPPGSGKTMAVRRVIRTLQTEGALAGAAVWHRKWVSTEMIRDPVAMVKEICNINYATQLDKRPLSALFVDPPESKPSKRVVLLFDHFDHIEQQLEHHELESFVAGLAEDARSSNKYMIMLVVSKKALAKVWWEC
jgi:hypothetical protein